MPVYDSPYERRRLRVLAEMIPAGQGLVIDLGCNLGLIGDLIAGAGYDVIGFDIDEEILKAARQRRPERIFRVGDSQKARELKDCAGSVCLELIEHVPYGRQIDILEDLAAATTTGGWLLFSTPMRYSVVSIYERLRRWEWTDYCWWDDTHISVTTWRRTRRLLAAAGYQIERVVGFHLFPPICGRLKREPIAVPRALARISFDPVILARKC